MRRPRIKIVPVANLVALAVLGTLEARTVLRRRRAALTLSPVADYARPGWRMPGARGS